MFREPHYRSRIDHYSRDRRFVDVISEPSMDKSSMDRERRGQSRFAVQVGPWGLFADVQLLVLPGSASDDRVALDVAHLAADPRRRDWIAGIDFGVQYALECLPLSERDISICITHLHTNPVDSSTMSVAFAACFAVWDAVGCIPKAIPRFDEDTRAFVFPQ